MKVLYQSTARATGGRDGRSVTLDGTFEVSLIRPKEIGGLGGDGANPEKLFAADYVACFLGAMNFVASQGGPKIPSDATVTATVGIGPRGGGGFGPTIALSIAVPNVPRDEVEALVATAIRCAPIPTRPATTSTPSNRARPPKPRPAPRQTTEDASLVADLNSFWRATVDEIGALLLRRGNLREPAILHYASRMGVFPISQRGPLSSSAQCIVFEGIDTVASTICCSPGR